MERNWSLPTAPGGVERENSAKIEIMKYFKQEDAELELEVSTVHSQTMENNGLTAYSSMSWTVNILGRQRLVNGSSLVSHYIVME